MSFPICRDLTAFEQQKWPTRLRQMSPEDAAAVERLQPFPARTGRRYEALRWVNTQSNIDKHRLVMPAYVAVVDSEIRLRAIPADVTIEVPIQGGENIRLEDGALVARLGPVRTSQPKDLIPQGAEPPKLDVYINTSPLLEPVFGDGLRMNFLPPIAKDIRAIVEEFAHRFAPPSTDA